MANGDPLVIGVAQPPDNRATSATLLVHNGSAFGTQHTAFWVQRHGAPACNAAIRGDNFSSGGTPGVTKAGVMGMTQASASGLGVLGTATGAPNLFFGEAGVMGVTNSYGVVGKALTGVITEEQGALLSATGVVGQCDAGVGVHGVSKSGFGIIGESTARAGVTGKSVTGIGLEARSEQSHGVQATTQSGVGVFGESVSNTGVIGASRDGVGVEGLSTQGFAGVLGQSERYGVLGESNQGVGVIGLSPRNGIRGVSTDPGGVGTSGWSRGGAGVQGDSETGIGVGGRSPRGWAGFFEGNVGVRGGLFVAGGPKSAAVEHPDGTHRALFCLESPESFFEDFGEAVFAEASVTVALDADFAALVKRARYQVFLTSYGPQALYVKKRGPEGFVIARVPGTGGEKLRRIRVGYRIVARRADLRSTRLPKIRMPAQGAVVPDAELPAGKAKGKRAGRRGPSAEREPLPATPRIPSPDIEAMAEATAVDAKENHSRR